MPPTGIAAGLLGERAFTFGTASAVLGLVLHFAIATAFVLAYRLALDHPERVESLALLCTFSRGREAILPSWPIVRHGIPARLGSPRSRACARSASRRTCPSASGATG